MGAYPNPTPECGKHCLPHGHSFAHVVGTFPSAPTPLPLGSSERPLMSRSHSYKPFKAGKNHLLSAHPLENPDPKQTSPVCADAVECQEGLPSQVGPPDPSGESGLGLEGALWLWAPGVAQAEHIARHPRQPGCLAASGPDYSSLLQMDSSLPWVSTHLAGCFTFLLPSVKYPRSPRTQSLSPCLSPMSIQFLRGSLQFPSF